MFSVNQEYDLEYYKTKAANTRAASIASKTAAATQHQQIIIPAAAVLEAPLAESTEIELTVAPTITAESVPVVSNAFDASEATSVTKESQSQQPKVTETVATETISTAVITNESAERTVTLAVAAAASSIIVTSQPSTAALQPMETAHAHTISIVSTMSKIPTTSQMIGEASKRDGVSEEDGILMDIMGIIDEMVLEVIIVAEAATTATKGKATITTSPQLDDNVSSNPSVITTLNANEQQQQQQLTPLITTTISMFQSEMNTCDVIGDGDTMGDDEATMIRKEEIKKKKMEALKTESLWLEKSLRERIQVSIFDNVTFSYDIHCFVIPLPCTSAFFCRISPCILIRCFVLSFTSYPNRFCKRHRRSRAID